MIKLMLCLRRRQGMTREAFQDYWRGTHRPLFLELGPVLGVRRYVQNHTVGTDLDAPMRAGRGIDAEPYDGVAEVYWDSEPALLEKLGTREGIAASYALIESDTRFIDFGASRVFFVDERADDFDGNPVQ